MLNQLEPEKRAMQAGETERKSGAPFALILLAVLLVGGLLFIGLPLRRSAPAGPGVAVVYAPSSALKQVDLGGVLTRTMTSSDPQAKVENFYQKRLGLENTRTGAQSKRTMFGEQETSGVVDFQVETNSVLALSQVIGNRFSAVLIEPGLGSNDVQILLIEHAFKGLTPSAPVGASEIPVYPGVEGPFGASGPQYRGLTFETADAVESVAGFYRTNLSGWQMTPSPGVVAHGEFLLATRSNRILFLRAIRSTNENLTKVLWVVGGQ